MNFITGTVTSEKDRVGVAVRSEHGGRTDTLFLPLPQAPAKIADWMGREVVLGLRPETITAHDPRTADGNPSIHRFDAQVSVVEPTGADTLVYISLGGRDAIARVNPKDSPVAGQTATFMVDMSRASLFDPKSEQRI